VVHATQHDLTVLPEIVLCAILPEGHLVETLPPPCRVMMLELQWMDDVLGTSGHMLLISEQNLRPGALCSCCSLLLADASCCRTVLTACSRLCACVAYVWIYVFSISLASLAPVLVARCAIVAVSPASKAALTCNNIHRTAHDARK
jgi:hypothetical protein